jgi:uncharacterized protein YjiS (DUF1127 family)
MSATAILPAVLCDTRPARGKHRTRRTITDAADAVLAWSRRARGAFHLTGMTAGALAAAVLS